MKFECTVNTDDEFMALVKSLHEDEETGFNWEVVSFLWASDETETVRVEYQVITAAGLKNFEMTGPSFCDRFTAYIAKNEEDYDPDNEVDYIDVGREDFSDREQLKNAMFEYAKKVLADK